MVRFVVVGYFAAVEGALSIALLRQQRLDDVGAAMVVC